jgi:phage shock protein A
MFRFFGSIFRWVGLKLGLVNSSIDAANDRLLKKNPELLRREGQLAQEELKANYRDLHKVIAGKVASRNQKDERILANTKRLGLVAKAKSGQITTKNGKDRIEQIGYDLSQLSTARTNATKKLKEVANRLGVTDTNSPAAQNDPEFLQHRTALSNFLQKEKDLKNELDQIEANLRSDIETDTTAVNKLKGQLSHDKTRLEKMERDINNIPGQIEEAINEIMGAEEAKRQNEILRSIDTSNAENRLANIDRLKKTAVAEGEVANEMASPVHLDSEYLNYTNSSDVDDEINALLSVGNTTTADNEKTAEVDQLPEG